jgi:hypothetical protein
MDVLDLPDSAAWERWLDEHAERGEAWLRIAKHGSGSRPARSPGSRRTGEGGHRDRRSGAGPAASGRSRTRPVITVPAAPGPTGTGGGRADDRVTATA